MEDGGQRMENGGWRMENGGWRMENGGWGLEDGDDRRTLVGPVSGAGLAGRYLR